MPVRKINPTSPGQRGMSIQDFSDITTDQPEASLLRAKKRINGRNNTGRVTCRHKGGGHKRAYRLIDFKRNKIGVPGKVETIEYDPNRNSRISLIVYVDGEKRYILTPVGLNISDIIENGPEVEPKIGNALPLANIPLGTYVHNIELQPGKGGQMARAAGSGCQLMAKEGDYVTLRLQSSEMRLVRKECYATIGVVGNLDAKNISIGKAGRNRWRGIRPTVRGVATNACDHPHGGGEGKSPIGGQPRTPWGKPTLGYKTRKKRKKSNELIVRSRHKNKK